MSDRLSKADNVLRKGDASLQDSATDLHKLDDRETDAAREAADGRE